MTKDKLIKISWHIWLAVVSGLWNNHFWPKTTTHYRGLLGLGVLSHSM